jgi:hypothetical protein
MNDRYAGQSRLMHVQRMTCKRYNRLNWGRHSRRQSDRVLNTLCLIAFSTEGARSEFRTDAIHQICD